MTRITTTIVAIFVLILFSSSFSRQSLGAINLFLMKLHHLSLLLLINIISKSSLFHQTLFYFSFDFTDGHSLIPFLMKQRLKKKQVRGLQEECTRNRRINLRRHWYWSKTIHLLYHTLLFVPSSSSFVWSSFFFISLPSVTQFLLLNRLKRKRKEKYLLIFILDKFPHLISVKLFFPLKSTWLLLWNKF